MHDGAAGPYVHQETSMLKKIHTPKDKIFSLNAKNSHFLTCHKSGALIYRVCVKGQRDNVKLFGWVVSVWKLECSQLEW